MCRDGSAFQVSPPLDSTCLESGDVVARRFSAPNAWSLKQGLNQYLLYKLMSQATVLGEMLLVNLTVILFYFLSLFLSL